MKKAYIEEAKGIPEGAWVWCLHCERCYIAGEFREVQGTKMCPYNDCGSGTAMDAWGWENIRENHKEYPKEPERDKVYPQY
jgi:hypothetical protein